MQTQTITIILTVVVFLIVFGILMLTAGPTQSGRSQRKRRQESDNELNGLSVDDYEYGFEPDEPAGYRQPEPRPAVEQTASAGYRRSEPRPAAAPQRPAPQRTAPQPTTYQGNNYRIEKSGRVGKCGGCGAEDVPVYRFTLTQRGRSESKELCASCCKLVIRELEKG